jgi:diguanylate cyclase (GGDEF)-like protein
MLLASDDAVADVLVVDDTHADLEFMAAVLTAQGYRVRVAASASAALEEIARAQPDLVLLDINMPEMDGFELCRHLKQSVQFDSIPVIFISVSDDTETKVAAFGSGGIDYVTKPFRVAEIKVRIHAHLQQKRARDRLGFQAGHDPLTGLPNRSLLMDRLRHTISFAERYGGQVAIAYIDLDKFKMVNDRFGHDAGDQLLIETARRLRTCVRESDTIARLGGDEFIIVFYSQSAENVGAHAMQHLLECMSVPMVMGEYAFTPSCSIGLACYPQDGRDVETLLKNADTAMYRAKELGRNNIQFYTDELNSRINQRMALEKSLRGALERDEFILYYQPRIALRSGRVIGLEALIRWQHPELGLLLPSHFIPMAEEAGLIDQIGDWVVRAACIQHLKWQDQGIQPVPIGINISRSQFLRAGFAQSIALVLRDTGIAGSQLELDLKESLLMDDPALSMRVLQELKRIGVGLSIDDFGTGFSNLGHLKRFPLDRIKLDPSFIKDMHRHPDDLAVVDTVISMAHSLHMKVAVEGAESANQLVFLADRGCDEMQGDYFSPALPVALCSALLQENRSLSMEVLGRRNEGRTLLLIEDEACSSQALSRISPLAGYRMLQALNAAAAFDILAAQEVSVIVCDQKLPGMSGIEFFCRIKKMYPHTVRILLSAEVDTALAADAINRGNVYKLLHTPWNEAEFTEILDAAFVHYESGTRFPAACREIS